MYIYIYTYEKDCNSFSCSFWIYVSKFLLAACMGPLSRTGFSRHRTARWTSILKKGETVRSCMLLVDSGQMEWKWINLMNVLIKPHLWSFMKFCCVEFVSQKNHHTFLNKWWATAVFVCSSKKKTPRIFTPRSFASASARFPQKTQKNKKTREAKKQWVAHLVAHAQILQLVHPL